MKNKFKTMFRNNKFTLVFCIVTLLIGVIFYKVISFGIEKKLLLFLICFIPFFIFLIITILPYKYKEKYKNNLKIISIVSGLLLLFYYFITFIICVFVFSITPVSDYKYYNYYVTGSRLQNIFPKEIPSGAKNIDFYYFPGLLQAGRVYSLYYIDDSMTKELFEQNYKSKAIWSGFKEEYIENEGLLTGIDICIPDENDNIDDYIIYLIEGSCDESFYCNHGIFLLSGFNEKTNEVIFCSEEW